MFDVCVDVAEQRWESRTLFFDRSPVAVADAVAREIAYEPELDARLSGCDRGTLSPMPGMGAFLCYVADPQARSADPQARSTDPQAPSTVPGLG